MSTNILWRPVLGFEHRYEVSESGEVRSLSDRRWYHRLTQHKINSRYVVVYCHDPVTGKNNIRLVHRLVAEVHIPNPDKLAEVNHIDGNKLNNAVSNLEWVSREDNKKHAVKHGLTARGEKHRSCKLTEDKVRAIRVDLQLGSLTLDEIAGKHGTTFQNISCIKRGKSWAWLK